GEDRPEEGMLGLVRDGLGRTGKPQSVVVVGAGMAGLVAAYELQRAGHRVTVLEAQQRVGGRVWTLREPFTHGLYAEGGAMRLPAAHLLSLAYVENASKRGASRLETSPFKMANPHAYVFVRTRTLRSNELQDTPAR